MTERFVQLYKLQDNLYINESPIIISAGSLLKDSQTGSIIVQLKFHSVSESTIKAVKVSISTFDVSGTELQGVKDYQYLDLSICNGQEFGSNKAIVLPSAVTRSFVISDITVVFSNDNQWKYNNSVEMVSLPTLKHLSTELHNAEIEKQYKIATTPSATYIPSEIMSIWSCTCGEWNTSTKCTKCGSTKQMIFSALDIDELKINAEMRIASERVQQEQLEEEARRESKKEQQKRKRGIVFISIIVLLLITILFCIFPKIITSHNSNSVDKAYSGSKKSNLDWVPYDSTPNDNSFIYYKIELTGTDSHARYVLDINTDTDTIVVKIDYYKNEWSELEGGRISGRRFPHPTINWTDLDKTSGEFTLHSDSFAFKIDDGRLTITAKGDDDYLAGTYKQALPK